MRKKRVLAIQRDPNVLPTKTARRRAKKDYVARRKS